MLSLSHLKFCPSETGLENINKVHILIDQKEEKRERKSLDP